MSGTMPASLQRGSNFQAGQNATVAATTDSQRVRFLGTGTDFLFQNTGNVECFVAVGDASVTATAGGSVTADSDGSLSVPAGAVVIYNFSAAMGPLQGAPVHVAALTATGTATLRISQGLGS